MSCYFRHVKGILSEAGVVVAAGDKKQIDKVFHEVVSVTCKDCHTTWRTLNQYVVSDNQKRPEVIRMLQAAIH